MNDSARLIKKFAGRKGGRRRVKKGFATNPKLASEAGKKAMANRWHSSKQDNVPLDAPEAIKMDEVTVNSPRKEHIHG